MGRPVKNRAGVRYGRLIALRHVASDLRKQAIWLCICDCGAECQTVGSHLESGATVSCGCYRADVRRARPMRNPEDRFWAMVEIPFDPDECWSWIGGIDGRWGYGKFGAGKRDDGILLAHRFAYELFYGPVPCGLDVCHACNNPNCVNFSHLYAGTRKQNMEQAQRQGRLVRKEYRAWSAERRAAHEARKAARRPA